MINTRLLGRGTTWAATGLLLLLPPALRGQTEVSPAQPLPQPTESVSIFNHSTDSRVWISGQSNFITQVHGDFRAPYTGTNSLLPKAEIATSRVLTLYTGLRVSGTDEILLDLEESGGDGLSSALGVAGFPNLDVVRNPYLSKAPYLARLMFHHVIPLSDKTVDPDRGPLGILKVLPTRRIDLRVGKFSTVDFFDVNMIGSDTHLQFMNWAVDNNGAYDYAADTRGYTLGLVAEYRDGPWGLRFGEALMPTVANGIDLDWDLSRAHSENLEFEWHHSLFPGRLGTWRLLGFENHARMGNYEESIARSQAGLSSVPDITSTRAKGRTKYGFGLNGEQDVSDLVGVFFRYGWNDGRNESFAYTEVDNTILVGGDLRGAPWGRAHDRLGLALVSNGISSAHARYLTLGGLGFLLGDGGLRYGRETIVEAYYTAHIWRGVFISPNLQRVQNPGYNRDRGPVLVSGFRFHTDF